MFTVLAFGDGFENDEALIAFLVEIKQGCFIIHSVTIVWSWPNSNQLLIEPVNVSFLNQLMGPHNQINPIQQVEMVDNFMSKNPSSPSCIPFPSFNVFRVRPHQICHWSFMRNLLLSINQSHLINCWQVRRQSTMDTKDCAVDDGAQRKVIKGLIKIFPAIWVAILFVYLVQKSVHHGNVSTFVVSSEEINSVRVFNFETKEECDCFNRVVPSVYKISDHDELVIGDSSSLFEHLLDVVELSVNVACDFDRAIHRYDVWLLCEDASYHIAKLSDSWFSYGFAGPCLLEPLIDTHVSA